MIIHIETTKAEEIEGLLTRLGLIKTKIKEEKIIGDPNMILHIETTKAKKVEKVLRKLGIVPRQLTEFGYYADDRGCKPDFSVFSTETVCFRAYKRDVDEEQCYDVYTRDITFEEDFNSLMACHTSLVTYMPTPDGFIPLNRTSIK